MASYLDQHNRAVTCEKDVGMGLHIYSVVDVYKIDVIIINGESAPSCTSLRTESTNSFDMGDW